MISLRPDLDPDSILYGHGTGTRGPAPRSTPDASRIGGDGIPLYLVERDPDKDWDGQDLMQIWLTPWSYEDHRHGDRAEPIAFWTTEPNILTWDQAQEQGCLHNPDGPAARWEDDREQWFEHGRLHRAEGPAWILRDSRGYFRELYYLEGQRYAKRDWFRARYRYF